MRKIIRRFKHMRFQKRLRKLQNIGMLKIAFSEDPTNSNLKYDLDGNLFFIPQKEALFNKTLEEVKKAGFRNIRLLEKSKSKYANVIIRVFKNTDNDYHPFYGVNIFTFDRSNSVWSCHYEDKDIMYLDNLCVIGITLSKFETDYIKCDFTDYHLYVKN